MKVRAHGALTGLLLLVACQDAAVGLAPPAQRASPLQPAQRWLGYTPPTPSDVELQGLLDEALELRWRKDSDRWLDALEPGEQFFHATLTQDAIDRLNHGPEALFVVGDDLFEVEARRQNGLGNALANRPDILAGPRDAPNMRRVHQGDFGGPEAYGCSECHFKGGLNGAGTATQNTYLRGDGNHTLTADERNAPHLLGLGPVQALAIEMGRALQTQRDEALVQAAANGAPVLVALATKGISFGTLTAHPDGSVDTSGVEGVDVDLTVRPFGWKGHQATLRRAAEEAFRIHMGLVSTVLEEQVAAGQLPRAIHGDGDTYDMDRDGVRLELDDGMLTTMVFYLAQLEIPVVRVPADATLADQFARGRVVMTQVGCTSCHVAELILADPQVATRPDATVFQTSATLQVNVARGGETPKIEPTSGALNPTYRVPLFSDLKRHEMGDALASPAGQGNIPATVFLTRPLWGLADTAPYLHDGRAPTVADAILAHGGEALQSAQAYAAASAGDQAALLVFLAGLTRNPRVVIP